MIPQQAVMKDALNEARCSNELLEHLEHLHETNDLFGNVAKSQGHIHVQKNSLPIILFAGKCRQSASKVCANPIESPSAGRGTLPRIPRTISVGRLTSHSSLSSHVFQNCRHGYRKERWPNNPSQI
jgi:hypothetical protein